MTSDRGYELTPVAIAAGRRLSDRLFGGKVTELVNHLIAEHDIDRAELAELNRLIAHAERQSRRRDRS